VRTSSADAEESVKVALEMTKIVGSRDPQGFTMSFGDDLKYVVVDSLISNLGESGDTVIGEGNMVGTFQ